MKKTLLLLFIVTCNCLFAQENGLKARIEFEEAEKEYAEGNYELALEKLKKVESLLGKWTPKTGYLKILVLDELSNYNDLSNKFTTEQEKKVKTYMAYANANQSEVDLDKFKMVYKIEEKINNLNKFTKEEKIYNEMPEFVKAKNAMKNEEYSIAMTEFKAAAAKGNPNAMIEIGNLYRIIKDLRNEKEALHWYGKATENGRPGGYQFIGEVYMYSKTNKDYELAFNYFMKAYKMDFLGWTKSRNILAIGDCYYNGTGVKKDIQEAAKYYSLAVKMENIAAMTYLGRMLYYGYGIGENRNEGLKLLKISADNNFYLALIYLGDIYFDENDFKLSFNYYEQAVSRKKNNMDKLGDAWKKGELLDIQTDFAVAWLNDLAATGDKDAMYGLHKYYENKDKKLSKEWRNKWESAD